MSHPVSSSLLMFLVIMAMPLTVLAQADVVKELAPGEDARLQNTITTLGSLIKLQSELKDDIKNLASQLDATGSASEKKELQVQLDKLEVDLQTTTRNLKEIAAGADIASRRAVEDTKFNLQEEVFSLLRPALKEMREMTSHVRQKSDLKDKITYYQEKLPVAELAVANITELLNENENESLEK